ncbi:cytochrome o ubiquinol oxidase subunit IV [Cognatilysobacter bugurensis]|uniref:Cytochrome bo(3) ubiquinol oxidase subunit 4 n=1 Tax=Cognatilysobacter bugurensis TaxID=543356 RepID=A0A918SVV5_9GAMM|nr:cytochrome o ubiquinol oxidase subunit IV [Lysobacter bugurensis]GHA73273.1 cytochrome o ubiquinol oxidase subunit IV [Lysobacter bugurensis]
MSLPHELSHEHGHDAHGDDGIPHASLRDYVTGFVLSVLLTAVPFGLVMGGAVANPAVIAGVILVFAALQVVVHMVYFLHMNPRSEGGWNLLALLFTAVLVIIVLAGSLWVMHHMNTNMMPTGHDAHAVHAASQSVL